MTPFDAPAGRYAPSPSGDLHFGNLRTAVLAWLFARQSGRRFYMRVEDVDSERSSAESARRQLEDLAASASSGTSRSSISRIAPRRTRARWLRSPKKAWSTSAIARAATSAKQRPPRMFSPACIQARAGSLTTRPAPRNVPSSMPKTAFPPCV